MTLLPNTFIIKFLKCCYRGFISYFEYILERIFSNTMAKIILVTGGVRSGKSRFAEQLLQDRKQVVYVATARCLDEEMARRIHHHQSGRPATWTTCEASSQLDVHLQQYPSGDVLLDCVSNMITNLMLDAQQDYEDVPSETIEKIEKHIQHEFQLFIDACKLREGLVVIVTNEVGWCLVSPYRMGRIFSDIIGRVNQQLADQADEVFLMVCGLPQKLKG